jgi:hypothetical protein
LRDNIANQSHEQNANPARSSPSRASEQLESETSLNQQTEKMDGASVQTTKRPLQEEEGGENQIEMEPMVLILFICIIN